VQEVEQVVGVLPGGVEADGEVNRAETLGNAFQALTQLGIAGGRLGEGEVISGRLEVVAEEGDIMTVAGGVDADATAAR
jgi:hypothetical protein